MVYFTTAYICVSRANNVKRKEKKNAHYTEAKEQELFKSILNILAEFANFTK